jgi:hypothetical protein
VSAAIPERVEVIAWSPDGTMSEMSEVWQLGIDKDEDTHRGIQELEGLGQIKEERVNETLVTMRAWRRGIWKNRQALHDIDQPGFSRP